MPNLNESELRRQQYLRRVQPGNKALNGYGGEIREPRGGETVRIVPTLCGRCQGYGRVGDEIFCPVCQGACYVDPSDAYEPYYADDAAAIHRSLLPANRSYAERSRHPAHPPQQKSSGGGVRVRSAGRRRQ